MADRAVTSGVINFGKLNIPVKYFVAAKADSVKFRKITPAGNPLKREPVDPVSGEDVKPVSETCSNGFEYEKGKFVSFSKEELNILESNGTNGAIEIDSFITPNSINPIHIETSYYIKPINGAERSYKLLVLSLMKANKIAVGYWTYRGKDHLVIIRPYKNGLLLHTLFYINEVRDYEDNYADVTISDLEIELASQLVKKMSKKFDIATYRDKFAERVLSAVEEKKKNPGSVLKVKVAEITPSTDIFTALRASLEGSNYDPGFRFAVDKPADRTHVKKVPKKGNIKK